ncbi:MAG: DNA phosphorothioation system sulfurtransferase DndC, partial [Actinomycetota bacterium]|nr:DNA phosphorothioation system sulfurtransferase DndC [Actinomycetota bacterium]
MTTTSAFENGMSSAIERLSDEVRSLYLEDEIPWVVGYSGGKDSTATLQLVWLALAELPESQRTKDVYVITTDTLVENPIVGQWVNHSLDTIQRAAEHQALPITPHRLTPKTSDSFWVNLIGKGYPAPK